MSIGAAAALRLTAKGLILFARICEGLADALVAVGDPELQLASALVVLYLFFTGRWSKAVFCLLLFPLTLVSPLSPKVHPISVFPTSRSSSSACD